jgi:hypothetical protein
VADFHTYTITMTAEVCIPATSAGAAQTFDISTLPNKVRSLLATQFQTQGAAVGTPVVTASAATEVPPAP